MLEEPSQIMAPSSDAEQGLPALAAPSPSPMDPFGKGAGRHDSIVRLRDKASSMDEGDIIVKPLTPLVAMPPPSDAVVNSTLSRQNYSRLGRNLLFEARPAVVHFGGYSLGKAHSQCVRVVNVSSSSQRLHILGPATDFFKTRCNKKGLVAPGSSEVIMVDFHPREHRYHYDCVRLHTDSDNLLIPLHAYPVMNDVVFPTRVDFGVQALGKTTRRTIKMVCQVPIQFEYEIEVTKSHPHLHVGCLRGIVPANGAAEVHLEYQPTNGSSAEMELLVTVSQFNFTPIICIVTGAGRPGLIRQHSLDAAASRLGEEILRDSLGAACHTVRRVREVRQSKQPSAGPPSQTATASRMLEDKRLARFGSRANVVGKNRRGTSGCNDDSGYSTAAGLRGRGDGKSSAETECASGTGRAKGDPKSHGVESHDRGETGTFEQSQDTGTGCKGADRVDTWATRPTSAEHGPYRTGKGSGAVFDAGGEWLAGEKRAGVGLPVASWAPPEGSAFGSIPGQPATTIVEGLVIPARLDTVQATNFVLTQQPGKLKPKDLKDAIRRARQNRQHQLEEQEALRAMTTSTGDDDSDACSVVKSSLAVKLEPEHGDDPTAQVSLQTVNKTETHDQHVLRDTGRANESGIKLGQNKEPPSQPAQLSGKAICAYERTIMGVGNAWEGDEETGDRIHDSGKGGGGGTATRQLKEMSFLHDLAAAEAEERDRSFKGSVEYVGEPLLTQREMAKILEERRRGEHIIAKQKRAQERGLQETRLRGPGGVGEGFARASLLLTGHGTQGYGFDHKPDWDIYRNDDWGKRREVLRRLVTLVGRWIIRRRAGKRLAAIQARLRGFHGRAEVAQMVERDSLQAKLSSGPKESASQDLSWKSAKPGDDGDHKWDFPDPFVTSHALAAEMAVDHIGPGNRAGRPGWAGSTAAGFTRASGLPIPPPPEFQLSSRDIKRHRFPVYDEDAAVNRQAEVVDELGPPTDFIDIDLLPLRESEEGKSMGYENIPIPRLGTYPSIEKNRALRWSAFEECGVRQPRDAEETIHQSAAGADSAEQPEWRTALSSSERRSSKATLGRRRSSVGLRMTSTTAENPDEAWLAAAEEELTALAADAELVERLPDHLLFCPNPPGGVDMITPNPRFKPFLPELPADEASPEWCLRPREIHREVPVTKGLLLGYAPGSTSLRAYANAPRLSNFWKPTRERRSSGLSCMKGQSSRGVWQPQRGPKLAWKENTGNSGCGISGEVANNTRGRDSKTSRADADRAVEGARGTHRNFELAPEVACAAAMAGDGLSDSESEDEGDEAPRPTPEDARLFFDVAAAGAAEQATEVLSVGRDTATAETRENKDTDDARGSITGGSLGRGGPKEGVMFAREIAVAKLERVRTSARERDAERLATRMGAIAAEVQNNKHAFVLQTPYHRIRSREPEGM